MGCKGTPKGLELIQIATSRDVYLVDCQRIGGEQACALLEPLSFNRSYIKLIHDHHKDALALQKFGGNAKLLGLLDTQLLAELVWKQPSIGFNDFLSKPELPKLPIRDFFERRKHSSGVDPWSRWPIAQASLYHVGLEVASLQNVAKQIIFVFCMGTSKNSLSHRRLGRITLFKNSGSRTMCCDKKHESALVSTELIRAFRPDYGFYGDPLEVGCDADERRFDS